VPTADGYLSYLPAAFSVEQYNGLTLAAALPLDVAFVSSPRATADEFVSSRSSMKYLPPRQWEDLRASLPAELLNDPEAIAAQRAKIRAQLCCGPR
jgi:long-chain acyl-CoA synthetase